MSSPQKSPGVLHTEFFSPPSSSSSYINYNYNNITAYSPVSSSSSNIWQEQGQTTLSNPSMNQNLKYRTGPAIQEESDDEIEELLIHDFNSRYCQEWETTHSWFFWFQAYISLIKLIIEPENPQNKNKIKKKKARSIKKNTRAVWFFYFLWE